MSSMRERLLGVRLSAEWIDQYPGRVSLEATPLVGYVVVDPDPPADRGGTDGPR